MFFDGLTSQLAVNSGMKYVMREHYNIRSLIKKRSKKHSYHMASEQHVRVEVFNNYSGFA
jgi:hypothetical protein